MVPAGNKANCFSWVNHSTKTIQHPHHHHHHHHHHYHQLKYQGIVSFHDNQKLPLEIAFLSGPELHTNSQIDEHK